MTFRVPISELDDEQLYDRLDMLSGPLDLMDPAEWAAAYGAELGEAYKELDRRLKDNGYLPKAWRWARTPV